MKFLVVIFLSLCFFTSVKSQNCLQWITFYLENSNDELYLFPDKLTDTVEYKKNIYKYKIVFFDCYGKAIIKRYNNSNKLIAQYEFTSGLGLLKGQVISTNPFTLEEKIAVSEYYQGIPNGTWYYFKKNGSVKKQREFIDGIEKK